MIDAELPIHILYQMIGIVAMVCSFISFQFKKNHLFLAFQCISCLLFSIQFYMTGAWVACIMNGICILRCIFYALKKNKIRNMIMTVIFCLMFIAAAVVSVVIFNEKLFIAIICCLASIVSTIAISTKINKVIQICQLSFVSPVWLFNGIYYVSIGGIIAESANIISVIIAIIRQRKKAD